MGVLLVGLGVGLVGGASGAENGKAAAKSGSAAGGQAAAGAAALIPKFTPDGGVLASKSSIQLSAPAPGLVIRFTLDGNEPTASSPVFEAPFSIVRSTLVRARLFSGGQPAGPSVSRGFVLAGGDVAGFSGNLPIVVIQTFGLALMHETRRSTAVQFIDTKDGRSRLVGGEGQGARAEVWYRGNSSLRYLKRSMGVKLRDDAGKSQSMAVLGFPSDSDWVLYAPYPDKSLVRDVLAYDLSRQMGHYAARTRFVEVFLNEGTGRLTMENYMGVHVLEEKIKRSPARVNVQKLGTNDVAAPAITGGYIFKKDKPSTYGEVEPTFDGRPNWGGGGGGPSSTRYGYPTGPGGFPADPAGFLPTLGGDRASAQRERLGRGGRGGGGGGPGGQPVFEQDWRQTAADRPGRSVEIGDGRVILREGRGFRRGGGGGAFVPEESFMTPSGQEFYYVEPDEKDITPAQRQWLRGHLREFEQVLYGPNFADPTRGYAAYIDVDSFIDHHLTVEATKNIDGFRFSSYYHKDRGGKIKAQPIWDWNLSFGNANGKQGWMAERWYWPQLDDEQYPYFRRLFEDPEFGQRYVDRWGTLRATVFSDSNLLARIDTHVAAIGEARIRNFARWPILGRAIWPNYYVGETYDDEIRYLKEWTRKRLAWMDAQFTAAPRAATDGAGATRRFALSAPRGEVHFTTDGSDPRARGGQPSPKATLATQPVPVPPGTVITARAVFEGRWSPPAAWR